MIRGEVTLGANDLWRISWRNPSTYMRLVTMFIMITGLILIVETSYGGSVKLLPLVAAWVVALGTAIVLHAIRILLLAAQQQPYSFEIDDSGIVLRRAGEEQRIAWSAIGRARENSIGFYFYGLAPPKSGRVIVKRAIADDDLAPLRTLLRQRLGYKASVLP